MKWRLSLAVASTLLILNCGCVCQRACCCRPTRCAVSTYPASEAHEVTPAAPAPSPSDTLSRFHELPEVGPVPRPILDSAKLPQFSKIPIEERIPDDSNESYRVSRKATGSEKR